MATFTDRYPRNTPGKYYIDAQCTDCDLCRECAPNNIRRDDEAGHSYVFRQPTTPEEIAACEMGVQGCPTEAVGNDGDRYDWQTTPIRDWTTYLPSLKPLLDGLTVLKTSDEGIFPRILRWALRR
jgi:ferredoxin